jgi:hypothetical protein
MKITSVKKPKWANQEKTLIDLTIKVEGMDGEFPFTANPDDVLEHGRVLFEKCVAGDFGKISDYTPPSDEQLDYSHKVRRSELLIQSDWTQLPDVPQTVKTKWAEYRQALRDITEQDGYPQTVLWPEQPQ